MSFEYEIAIPGTEEAEYIGKMLLEYNISSKPITQEKPFISINRCIKNKNGEIIGGILACSALWNVLSIDTLWVKEDFRNKGLATSLLNIVEKQAKDMGCYISNLSTYDFQAKDLYLKNGYEIFGVLDDCPRGHKLYFLSKRL